MNLPQESCFTSYSPMSYHVNYEANYLLSLKFFFPNIKKIICLCQEQDIYRYS